MCRGGYSPKIDAALVEQMYQLKLQTGKAITQQANEAVRLYLANHGALDTNNGEEAPKPKRPMPIKERSI